MCKTVNHSIKMSLKITSDFDLELLTLSLVTLQWTGDLCRVSHPVM